MATNLGYEEHGIPSAYNRGCRCVECRIANTARRLRHRHDRTARLKAGLAPNITHGLAHTYTNWGCRCPECVTAKSAYTATLRQRSR